VVLEVLGELLHGPHVVDQMVHSGWLSGFISMPGSK
jgi:hypothetical protein